MKITVLSLLLNLLITLPVMAVNQESLPHLDDILSHRKEYDNAKEQHISILKDCIVKYSSKEERLKIYELLYQEYYVYKFDSAQLYVDKALCLSRQIHNHYHTALNLIYKARLFSIGGLYSEAASMLDSIDISNIDKELRFQYYTTYFTLYSYRSDYCNDKYYKPLYRSLAASCLRKAMKYLTRDMPEYNFYHGEYYIYAKPDDRLALKYYFKTLHEQKKASRYYAMACFAIANNYKNHNDFRRYEDYLIKASISDVLCSTRENLALQELATLLFEGGKDNIARADRYISIALEDAKFYNNRLRILEISQKLPTIVSAYENMIKTNNKKLKSALFLISLLIIISLVSLTFIFRQNKQLTLRRKQLSENNDQLTQLNARLNILNAALLDTNHKREGLAKLYIDLCAKYIDRLNKYKNLVRRKIKAHQVNELLSNISSSRLSEEDAATFITRFDKAFLDLYPTFIEEFNNLLEVPQTGKTKHPHAMTPEQRIYALIRLGVKESSEIASLLFYSPQTIYNYRSAVKAKAKNKNTFEDDVINLCTVIK